MSERDQLFGDDYRYFHAPYLTAAQAEADLAEVLDRLGGLPARVLDLGCGEGRLATRLASLGAAVVAVDRDPAAIAATRAAAVGSMTFVCGDLAEVSIDGEFDAVLCWFNAVGFDGHRGLDALVRQAAAWCRPGGQLLIDTVHVEGLLAAAEDGPLELVVERGSDSLVDLGHVVLDPPCLVVDRTVRRGGQQTTSSYRQALWSVPTWQERLQAAGFTEFSATGRSGEPVHAGDDSLVIWARRGR